MTQDFPALTVLIDFDLLAPIEDVQLAIQSLAQRVKAEGGAGITGYRFYIDPAGQTARGVVDYTSAQAWIDYHEKAVHWPEMAQWRAAARLEGLTFLGDMAPEIRAWMAARGMTVPTRAGYDHAAGFLRK